MAKQKAKLQKPEAKPVVSNVATLTYAQMRDASATLAKASGADLVAAIKGHKHGSLTMANVLGHALPATHEQAIANANVLYKALGIARVLDARDVGPHVHRGKKGGGLMHTLPLYAPSKRVYWGAKLQCEAHGVSFDKCTNACAWGMVAVGDKAKAWLGKAPSKPKATSKAKPMPVTTSTDGEAPQIEA